MKKKILASTMASVMALSAAGTSLVSFAADINAGYKDAHSSNINDLKKFMDTAEIKKLIGADGLDDYGPVVGGHFRTAYAYAESVIEKGGEATNDECTTALLMLKATAAELKIHTVGELRELVTANKTTYDRGNKLNPSIDENDDLKYNPTKWATFVDKFEAAQNVLEWYSDDARAVTDAWDELNAAVLKKSDELEIVTKADMNTVMRNFENVLKDREFAFQPWQRGTVSQGKYSGSVAWGAIYAYVKSGYPNVKAEYDRFANMRAVSQTSNTDIVNAKKAIEIATGILTSFKADPFESGRQNKVATLIAKYQGRLVYDYASTKALALVNSFKTADTGCKFLVDDKWETVAGSLTSATVKNTYWNVATGTASYKVLAGSGSQDQTISAELAVRSSTTMYYALDLNNINLAGNYTIVPINGSSTTYFATSRPATVWNGTAFVAIDTSKYRVVTLSANTKFTVSDYVDLKAADVNAAAMGSATTAAIDAAVAAATALNAAIAAASQAINDQQALIDAKQEQINTKRQEIKAKQEEVDEQQGKVDGAKNSIYGIPLPTEATPDVGEAAAWDGNVPAEADIKTDIDNLTAIKDAVSAIVAFVSVADATDTTADDSKAAAAATTAKTKLESVISTLTAAVAAIDNAADNEAAVAAAAIPDYADDLASAIEALDALFGVDENDDPNINWANVKDSGNTAIDLTDSDYDALYEVDENGDKTSTLVTGYTMTIEDAVAEWAAADALLEDSTDINGDPVKGLNSQLADLEAAMGVEPDPDATPAVAGSGLLKDMADLETAMGVPADPGDPDGDPVVPPTAATGLYLALANAERALADYRSDLENGVIPIPNGVTITYADNSTHNGVFDNVSDGIGTLDLDDSKYSGFGFAKSVYASSKGANANAGNVCDDTTASLGRALVLVELFNSESKLPSTSADVRNWDDRISDLDNINYISQITAGSAVEKAGPDTKAWTMLYNYLSYSLNDLYAANKTGKKGINDVKNLLKDTEALLKETYETSLFSTSVDVLSETKVLVEEWVRVAENSKKLYVDKETFYTLRDGAPYDSDVLYGKLNTAYTQLKNERDAFKYSFANVVAELGKAGVLVDGGTLSASDKDTIAKSLNAAALALAKITDLSIGGGAALPEESRAFNYDGSLNMTNRVMSKTSAQSIATSTSQLVISPGFDYDTMVHTASVAKNTDHNTLSSNVDKLVDAVKKATEKPEKPEVSTDVNGDKQFTFADVVEFATLYANGNRDEKYDFNGDSKIDFNDVVALATQYANKS